MTCRRVHALLLDYIDGSVSSATRSRMDGHLAGCDACRQKLQAQLRFARALSDGLRRETEALALRPETENRLLAASQRSPASFAGYTGFSDAWRRLAWPWGIAGALLIALCLITGFRFGRHGPVDLSGRSQRRVLPRVVSIDFSYDVPTLSDHRKGNLMIDSLTYTPCVVNESF